ncbi:hypothetical protein KUW09_24540 [Mameliella alba]|nr:hypothetical protein [Antarctobacter heliothermus]MBY6147242.1 hypothetical protein [Mameliella alba]MCA0957311.1 hypothetical protein [Mameliella alba]
MTDPQKTVAEELAAQGFTAAEIAGAMEIDATSVSDHLATVPPGRGPEAGPLRAILFTDRKEHRRVALPGSIWIAPCEEGERAALWFFCPCGCGGLQRITVGHRHKPAAHGPTWNWNGSPTDPTLHPSVNLIRSDSCVGWHGWLRGGYWEVV